MTPSTFQWTGAGGTSNWNDPGNWNLLSGAGSFPNADGDVAQFTSSSPGGTTATVNQPITVGEIDFGSTQSYTINGASTLTLQNSFGNSLINVGSPGFINSGMDTIAAPLSVNAGTPLAATLSGGTLALSNSANSITGTFTVNTSSTLQLSTSAAGSAGISLAGGSLAATGTFSLSNAVTLAAFSSNTIQVTAGTLSLSGISGGGALTKSGTGTLILGGVSYTGATVVSAGTLQLGDGVDPLNAITTSSIANSSNLIINDPIGSTATFAGVLSGPGSLTVTGLGAVTLSGANTYGGPTLVSSGSVNAANNTALGTGAVTVAGGATLNVGQPGLLGQYFNIAPNSANFVSLAALNASLAGMTPALTAVSSATSLNNSFDFGNSGSAFPAPYNSGASNFEADYTGSFNAAVAGAYTFDTGSDDGSMLFIDGNVVVNNNFFQGVTVRSGSVSLTAGPHNIVIAYYQGGGGYGFFADERGPNDSGLQRLSNALLDSAPTSLVVGSLAGAGTVALNNNQITAGADNNSTTFSGTIIGGAASGLTKVGSGTMIVGGVGYTGATVVSAGTLQLGDGVDALNTIATASIANSSNLIINDPIGSTSTFAGILSGSGSLTVTGLGALTLSGANTYSGPTLVSTGTVNAANNTALGSGDVTVAGGATLNVVGHSGLLGQYFNTAPNSANFVSLAALNASLAGQTPALTVLSSTTSLNNSFDFGNSGSAFPAPYNSGASNFEAVYTGLFNAAVTGTYTFDTGSDDGSMLFIDGNVVVDNNFFQGVTVRSGSVHLTAGLHNIVIAYYQGGGGYGLFADERGPNDSGLQRLSNSLLSAPTSLQVGSLAGAGTVALGNNQITAGADNQSTTFSGTITGGAASGLTKVGSGTMIVGGVSYTGATVVSAGTLQLGDGIDALNTIATAAIANSSNLIINDPIGSAATLAGILSGSGSLTVTGLGALTLSGANTYSGPTLVSTGTVNAASNTALGTGDVTVAGGATLNVVAQPGLLGQYFNTVPNSANFVSLAALNASLAGQTPALTALSSTTSLNNSFDFGNNGEAFPAPYNSGASNFEAVYTGQFDAAVAGTYTFDTGSDDGSKLFIDGNVVVNNNFFQGVTVRSGSVNLTAGLHSIVIAYYQGGGGYGFFADEQGPNDSGPQRLSNALLSAPTSLVVGSLAGAGTVAMGNNQITVGANNHSTTFSGTITGATPNSNSGLVGQYFSAAPNAANFVSLAALNASLAGLMPSLTMLSSTTSLNNSFDFGNNGEAFPAPYNSGASNFEAVHTGLFNATVTGNYTFDTGSDDGSMLFIDGNVVVNNNFFQGVTVRSGTVHLTAGLHDIVIAFYQGGGGYGFFADEQGPNDPGLQRLSNSLLSVPTPSVTKVGTGVLTLASGADANYTGPTTVSAGTLLVDGHLGIGTVTVSGGATLGGTGAIDGAVNLGFGATVAPGDGVRATASLATGNIALATGSSFPVEIGGLGAGQFDQLAARAGSIVNLASEGGTGATLTVALVNSFRPGTAGETFTIINNLGSSPISGTFNGLPEGATFTTDLITYAISYQGGDGNDVVLTVTQVVSAPSITTPSATFTVGANNAFQITATGNPLPTIASPNLPAGLSLSSSGLLTGTPSAGGGVYPFTVTASNGIGSPDSKTFTLTVDQAPTITTTSATFTAGANNAFQITATGFLPPPITSHDLPAGLNLSNSGFLSGIPSAGGIYTFTVTASNGIGSDSKTFTLTVVQAPSITTTSATFTVGANNAFQITATGFPPSTITSPDLPAGLSLSSSGLLSGIPSAGGIYTFTVTASNGIGSDSKTFTLTVVQAPSITTTSATFTVGANNAFQITATGNPPPTIASPNLPAGLNLSISGLLSGTPNAGGGVYSFTVTASNGIGSDSKTFTLTVVQVPSITTTSATFTVGANNAFQITATGFLPPTIASPNLPAGLNLSSSGLLSGTPTAGGGVYSFTVTASNGIGSDSKTFTLTVVQAPSITTTATNGTYGLGAMFNISVTFSMAVDVTGTPTLTLNSGGTASYVSGTGTNTLTFTYTVASGNTSSALDYNSTTALAGAITQHGGNNLVDLTLANPGATGSISKTKTLVIDTVVPSVTGVTTTAPSGTYGLGSLFSISIAFSKAVDLTGVPKLALNSGGTASYSTGRGTTTLTFTYTTSAGDSSTALDDTGATALSLNGGTIIQHGLAGGVNNASLTLAAPGQTGSISKTKSIVVIPAHHLAFVTSPQILTAGIVSNAITLQLRDASNHPITIKAGAEPFVVGLSTNSTSLLANFRDTGGVTAITSLSFMAGSSSLSLTYYDTKAGSPTLTARGATLAVTQTETEKASAATQIAFLQQPAASAYANAPIAPIVQALDMFNNVVPSILVTLALNPVNVPALATGAKAVLTNPKALTVNGLARFSTSSINLVGTYTVTASMLINGHLITVTSHLFTILANPTTPASKVR